MAAAYPAWGPVLPRPGNDPTMEAAHVQLPWAKWTTANLRIGPKPFALLADYYGEGNSEDGTFQVDPLLDTPDDKIDEVGVQILLTWFFDGTRPEEVEFAVEGDPDYEPESWDAA